VLGGGILMKENEVRILATMEKSGVIVLLV